MFQQRSQSILWKSNFLIKLSMPLTFQHSYNKNQSLTNFQFKEPLIVSYEFTSTVARKLFNFAPTLSNLNVSEYLSNP